MYFTSTVNYSRCNRAGAEELIQMVPRELNKKNAEQRRKMHAITMSIIAYRLSSKMIRLA